MFSKSLLQCKYGWFIHLRPGGTIFGADEVNGNPVETAEQLVQSFDVPGFVDTIVQMGFEYLIITVWHKAIIPLYPSAVNEKWRPGYGVTRDLIGEIIDGLTEKGIHTVLYTHPRDGHDLPPEEQEITGWGKDASGKPSPELFRYDIWNQYMMELYTELADRYAAKVSGVYTDGGGPYYPYNPVCTNSHQPVVDYLKIRDILKSRNPDLIMFQNYFGYLFSCDHGNTEEYESYIKHDLQYKNVEQWQAAKICTSLAPFYGGMGGGYLKRGEYAPYVSAEDIARYTMFNASCTDSGGISWASSPYAEGYLWPVGVLEVMTEAGRILKKHQEDCLDACCSHSYPTISGDSLQDRQYRFWMSSEDGKYEYLHCMAIPEDGIITWGKPEDRIELTSPVVMSGAMQISEFSETENGYRMCLAGQPDEIDTVIRFIRSGEACESRYTWINNDSKCICYHGSWGYSQVVSNAAHVLGCYERDLHIASGKDYSLYKTFEGSFLEIYGVMCPGNGSANVYIDGVFCGTIDQNADTQKARYCCFRSMNLYEGEHFVQLYTNDDKPFMLDAFRVIK